MSENFRRGPVPAWFIVLLVLLVLPGASAYYVMTLCPPEFSELTTLLKIYPFYIIIAALFAYICYPERRTVAWILVGMIILSHIAVAGLALQF